MDSSSTSTADSTFGLKIDREKNNYDLTISKLYDNSLSSSCFAYIDSTCVQCRENYFLQNGDCYSCPSSADILTKATVFSSLSSSLSPYYSG